ncbi:hypothetical protein [Streptomyces sp. NBC_01262]|uniref:hypothetical protein n=1 Tax=Streptomyces sp. NBC_01262 TaxID=2903803 RepID=UPI002E375D7C|nr:hypothetical protein [Streptomyces sp. NBC_01262]
MTGDEELLRRLREMWEATDPVPDGLADRVLFTLDLEHLEFELLRLHDAFAPQAARGHESARTITFSSDSLTVMVTVSPAGGRGPAHRLDCWIAPAAALRVELRTSGGSQETTADRDGRLSFPEVPAGLVQLVLHPTEGAALDLVVPVMTPAVQL